MENTILIIQTIFVIILMALFSLGLWQVYDHYIQQQKNVYWSIEDKPSKEALAQLLDDITVDMPEPDKTSYYSKQVLRSISKGYINPTKHTRDTLINNIMNQGIWEEKKISNPKERKFCYNQFELNIYSETAPRYADTEAYLGVWVEWLKTGLCRGNYIKRLNTDDSADSIKK